MENATKALLMAAEVFFGLIILTLLVILYTAIANYYRTGQEMTRNEQVTKFNSQYDAYIRNDVRGNEILTLVNKIVDYNRREADVEGVKYERMRIQVRFKGKTYEFKYDRNDEENRSIIIDFNNNTNDSDLEKISKVVKNIQNYTNVTYTEAQLQKLASEISNIFAPEDYPRSEQNSLSPYWVTACDKRNFVVKRIIGKEYDTLSSKEKTNLKEATLEYYQYQQFKRAHFNCVDSEVEYNKNTGRIVKLTFEFNGKFE